MSAGDGIKGWLASLGTLRGALCAVVVALTITAPFSGGQARYEGLPFVITVLAPSLFVMFTFILALDVFMTRIFMVDKQGAERARFKRILWIEGVLLVALVGAWSPLIMKLFGA